MTIRLYNTPNKHIDDFAPIKPGQVLMYSCGPTVYDHPHIGNWSAYIYWDTLVRILNLDGYDVKRVINITDVGHLTSDADEGDDKLEKGAKREGKTAWEVAEYYTASFMKGFESLNLVKPEYFPKATDYIEEQLESVRQLKTKGYTYQISDGIYYDTSKFPTYADFANLQLDDQRAGARVDYNPEKKNPSDFALWKFTRFGQKRDMEWETPVDLTEDGINRMGFPGWAIECSAMAMKLLGNTIDIHTGGIDHIPIHHTNEIAQSEAVTGVKLANYWLHNNHLKVDGTKISKSLGNGYTLENLSDRGFSPLDFRMLILQGHFRNEGNFTFDALQAARNRRLNWLNIAAIRHQIHDTLENDNENYINNETVPMHVTNQAIIDAISNDLGTPEALRVVDEIFSHMLQVDLAEINRQTFVRLLETIDELLGIELIDNSPDIDDDAKQLIIERNNARNNKDWQLSDKLRDKLATKNITLRDTASGVIWEYRY